MDMQAVPAAHVLAEQRSLRLQGYPGKKFSVLIDLGKKILAQIPGAVGVIQHDAILSDDGKLEVRGKNGLDDGNRIRHHRSAIGFFLLPVARGSFFDLLNFPKDTDVFPVRRSVSAAYALPWCIVRRTRQRTLKRSPDLGVIRYGMIVEID